MKLYEYQAKEIFSKYGIGIQKGKLAKTPQEAKQIAAVIGDPVVLKSQVLVEGRGKAGGVKIVDDLSDVEKVADKILKSEIKGYKPKGILVLEKIEIKQEFYLSIVLDRKMKKTLVIFSSFGGMDIEEVSKKHPEKIAKLYVEELLGIQDFHINQLLPLLNNDREILSKLKKIVKKLYSIYKKYDCLIVEINPLALTENGVLIALDGKIAAKYIKEHMKKPVVAFIAGEAAPEGKVMGHAGAIISPGGEGGVRYKREVLQGTGVHIIEKLSEIADIVTEIL